jgi:hypothetical protein
LAVAEVEVVQFKMERLADQVVDHNNQVLLVQVHLVKEILVVLEL